MSNANVKQAVGQVRYEVEATCPHCGFVIDLTRAPYGTDDEGDYGPAEDLLGGALFGYRDVPAKWDGLEIEYRCCSCKQVFVLSGFEV